MGLETLKGVEEIGGFNVCHYPKERDSYNPCHGDNHVIVDHEDRRISFTIQDGPVKENGVNGCQVDTIIAAALHIVAGLNESFPCHENAMTVSKLDEALMWLRKRKTDREKRGVEGFNKA